MLSDLIKRAKGNDKEAITELIEKFTPLLKKYSYMLNDADDAYQELAVFFLQLLNKIPDSLLKNNLEPKLLAYINTSVKRRYVYLSRKSKYKNHEINFGALSENQEYVLQCKLSYEDEYAGEFD